MGVSLTVLWPAMRVHRTGCSDAAKALSLHRDSATRTNVDASTIDTGDTVDAVLTAIVTDLNDSGDFDPPWTVGDLSVAPCVRDASKVVVAKPVPAGRCPGSGRPFDTSSPRWRGMGRPMYDPCPVCRRSYGTGRGVLPTHKSPTGGAK